MEKFLFVVLAVTLIQSVTSSPIASKNQGTSEIMFVRGSVGNVTYFENQPDLNFQDVKEVCRTGIWITYSHERYNEDAEEYYFHYNNIFIQPGSTCHTEIWGPLVGSTRFIGNHSNLLAPTVTLFKHKNFNGETAITFENEIPDITFDILSLMTYDTQLELFQGSNYSGESACLEIDPKWCDMKVCFLYIWKLFGELPWDFRKAKSARTGCQSTSKTYKPKFEVRSNRSFVISNE